MVSQGISLLHVIERLWVQLLVWPLRFFLFASLSKEFSHIAPVYQEHIRGKFWCLYAPESTQLYKLGPGVYWVVLKAELDTGFWTPIDLIVFF